MSSSIALPGALCVRISRRSFIVSSTSLAFCAALANSTWAAQAEKRKPGGAAGKAVNIWVTFQPDGLIEVQTPVVEIGTGTSSTMALYVAEELDADWKDLRVVTAPTNEKLYGNPYFWNWQIAAGVRTALGYYDALRLAGAQARHLLLTAAAARWSVPLNRLTTAKSVVYDKVGGRQLRYADLVADVVVPEVFPEFVDLDFQPQVADVYFGEPPPSPVKPGPDKPNALVLKRRSEFKLIGVNQPRLDIPSKSCGAAKYGIDTNIEGMLHAMVLVAPKIGGVPAQVDDKAARAVKGIVNVMTLPYGVAVVGTDIFSVREARKLVKVSWRDAPMPVIGFASNQDSKPGTSSTAVYPRYDSTATLEEFAKIARDAKDRAPVFVKGDAKRATSLLSGTHSEAVKIKTFETQSELVYHAPIEVQNAVVKVTPDKKSAQVWVGTQMATVEAVAVAEVLGISPEQVEVTAFQTGGAFGRRCEAGAAIDAAHISSRLGGKPVKVLWTREDDLRRNPHRMAIASRMEAAVDAHGKILATRHTVVADSWMARTQPDAVKQMGGTDINNWSAAIHVYDMPQIVGCVLERRAVDVCFMRGIAVLHNKFCQESLIDSLALENRIDPLQYRLDILQGEPRAQTVLREVAKISDWPRKRDGRQLGIAYGDYPNSHVATVAEISLDKSSGEIKVHKIWCVIDVGLAVMPDSIISQSEGGIVMALSMALKEKVTVKDNLTLQSNFHDYPIIRMSEVPDIEVKVLSTNNPIAGAGELAMYPVAPAINCALARITGRHLNKLPMLPEHVRERIET